MQCTKLVLLYIHKQPILKVKSDYTNVRSIALKLFIDLQKWRLKLYVNIKAYSYIIVLVDTMKICYISEF